MAEAEIVRVCAEAEARWPLQGCRVIHRHGAIRPGDDIVLVVDGLGPSRRGLRGGRLPDGLPQERGAVLEAQPPPDAAASPPTGWRPKSRRRRRARPLALTLAARPISTAPQHGGGFMLHRVPLSISLDGSNRGPARNIDRERGGQRRGRGGIDMARIALVTGGTRGIGAAISRALTEAGVRVAASYAGNDEAAEPLQGRDRHPGLQVGRRQLRGLGRGREARSRPRSARSTSWSTMPASRATASSTR